MDLASQENILALANEEATEKPIVVIGAPDPESAELTALTVTTGDPTFAGPLSGVQLGLPVYHALEQEFEDAVDKSVYEEHISMMAIALDTDGVREAMARVRSQGMS